MDWWVFGKRGLEMEMQSKWCIDISDGNTVGMRRGGL